MLNFFQKKCFLIFDFSKFHFQPQARTPRRKKAKRKPRRRFNFIDDEAGVSGDESSGDDSFIATQATKMLVVDEAEEGDPSVDMQARYLQSLR